MRQLNGERGTVAELTAVATGVEAGSGKRRRWRIDGEDPRRPVVEKATVAALQRVRDLVAWWRGRGGRGGSSARVGEARGRLWLRLWRTAATGAFGHEREGASERRGRIGGE